MLDPEAVLRIVSRMPLEDGVFLTGGQALNFWAERYVEVPELKRYAPYTSKDVDFFGRYEAAEKLAQALGGFVEKPNSDSPEAFVEAVVVASDEHGTYRIDFLNYVLGTEPNEVLKKYVTLHPLIYREGQPDERLQVPIMHPLHILQSRIANVVNLDASSEGEVSTRRRQAKAAPVILREYVRERLSSKGAEREVCGILKELHHWLRRDRNGRKARDYVDYDPIGILEEHLVSPELDVRWREHNLSSWIKDIENSRKNLLQRLLSG